MILDFSLSLQNEIDLSSVLAAEGSEVIAVAAAQDNVTEEAIGSPLAMWELEIQNIELEKAEGGLGFSILDYQVRNRSRTKCCLLNIFHILDYFHCASFDILKFWMQLTNLN